MQFQKCWAGPENNTIITAIHTTSLAVILHYWPLTWTKASLTTWSINYQRIPVISFTDHFKASFSILYADNALTPKIILLLQLLFLQTTIFPLPRRPRSAYAAMLPRPCWLAPPPGPAHHLLAASPGTLERLDCTLCDLPRLSLH